MKKHKTKRGIIWNRRVVFIFALICASFGALILRLAFITTGPTADTASVQSTRRVLLGTSRGYIYDRNGLPLVNTQSSDIGVVLCCPETLDTVNAILGTDELKNIKSGSLITADIEERLEENLFTKNFRQITHISQDSLCRHIIGYTDVTGHGVCGLEKAFDSVLSGASGNAYAEMTVDASGYALIGDGVTVKYDNYDSPAGLTLTVDLRIQQITENALAESDIECGAVVVMDCDTAEILAIASVPTYDITNLASALDDEDLPFLNRAVASYPVGSVFKPFIAAAALQNGYSLANIFDCRGEVDVSGKIFRCYNGNIHGGETLSEAIANSCNTYFVSLGLELGSEKVIDMCSAFGFGTLTELFPGDRSDAGNLPDAQEIKSSAQLANICFGQGELLATPVQLAAAYSVIANGGIYNEPYILNELIDDLGNAYGYFKPETESRRVLSQDACKYISKCLYNNMINGTGTGGRPSNTTAAGKTATAQTGRYYDDGAEQLCTWFAGFFPYGKPEYTVVVFNEKGHSAAADCAPVFKYIAENIRKIKK